MSVTSPKACVFGNPIEQSKSPLIHKMFAAQFGFDFDYSKRFAEPDQFVVSAIEFFSDPDVIGANVTMPFKHDAAAWVNELSEQAKRAGAVNTIIKTSHGYKGDNSDGIGLVNDFLRHNVELQNARLLLIGAGGAAKGALPALIEAGVKSVYVYNRSTDKAEDLVAFTQTYANNTTLANFQEQAFTDSLASDAPIEFDVIINATSLSLDGRLPNLPNSVFHSKPAVYDMVYKQESTVFLKEAATNGCSICIDGLGMLVEQAAYSFYLWFGKKPDTQAVYDALKAM